MTAPQRPRVLLPSAVGYARSWVGPDIVAGLSAGAVVVPQAMAYATIANLPVEVGLYTCIVPMLVYALLGGSRAMSVSTTSTIATLTATTLVSAGVAANADSAGAALGSLALLTLMVGGFLLLARVLSLGSLVENVSQATVLGIKIGVGATVAVGQLPKLLGESTNASGEGFFRSFASVLDALPGTSLSTLALSIGSILALVLLERFLPRFPGTLLVVAAGILLVAIAGIDEHGVALIDPVPSGLPSFTPPDWSHAGALVPGALAIALMSFLESATVARTLRERTDPRIDSDRELLATGAANTLGSFFGALPAAGGFSQSAVNQRAGARSQVAAMVTVALALAVALFLGPVLSMMPEATLAAMVFVAVAGLINIPELARWWRLSRLDFWIAVAVALLALVAGLLYAVAGGVAITLILVLRELDTPVLDVVDRRADAIAIHLGRGMYTANALANERGIVDIATKESAAAVVLEVSRLRIITVTIFDALRDLDGELEAQGCTLHFACLPDDVFDAAARTQWFAGLIAQDRVHRSVEEGLRSAVGG